MPAERFAGKKPEIGSVAPSWERWLVGSKPRDDWRLAGVFHGEAFPHPHSPPGRRRSQVANRQRDIFDGSYFSAANTL
jgi:hypothetical protein